MGCSWPMNECFCCGSENVHVILKKAYGCKSCGYVYRHFDGDLKKFYESYREASPLLNKKLRNKYTQQLLSILKDYIDKDDCVLEVGCGDGVLTEGLSDFCKKIICLDIDSKMVELAREKGYEAYEADILEFSYKDKFNVVIAVDVAEHVRDIQALIQKLNSITDGVIILQTPYKRRVKSVTPFDGHFHAFTPESLTVMFNDIFSNILFKETKSGETANGIELISIWRKTG